MMNIGQASAVSGVSSKMIRYYEQIGLIPPPTRGPQGYRHYSENDLRRLSFIRRARDLGFSMSEIGELLSLWHDQQRQSAQVKQLAQEHLLSLQTKIAGLNQMASSLQSLINSCAGDSRADCPILTELACETSHPIS